MTEGFDLVGAGPAAKRRGRPPGSRNKRAKDLASYVDVTCGGSAALQLARGCMVTVAEAKAAGGDLAKAEVAKARRRVEAFEAERARMDGQLRDVVRQELEACFEQAAGLENRDEVRKLVAKAVVRIEAASGGSLTLRDALDQMAEDRRALLPYTDQKQAQKVDLKATGFVPIMILDTGSSPAQITEQFQGPLIDVTPQGSHPKAQDDEET